MGNVKQIKTNKKVQDLKLPLPKETLYSEEYFGIGKSIFSEFINYLTDKVSFFDDACYEFSLNFPSGQELKFGFESSALPYCCGVMELGSLRCFKDDKIIPEITKMLDTIVNLSRGTTFIINTNGVSASVYYEKALSKCKMFTLVKTFKSSNSGNTIKMWVSNQE